MFIMRILSQRFLLSVVFMTAGGGAAYGTSIQLGKSGDIFELHIENTNCLLKVTLDKIETETVVRMVRKSNERKVFELISPCIDPNTEGRPSKAVTVSSAKYANDGMQCFDGNPLARIGEYVWKQGSGKWYPAEYTVERRMDYLSRGVMNLISHVQGAIQLPYTDNATVTGIIARKFCVIVAHRVMLVKQLISDWSRLDIASRIYGDNSETMLIWMHTRDILRNTDLYSNWVINNSEGIENVGRKKYNLEWITNTHDSVIFGALAKDPSDSRVFKYTNNCSAKKDCPTGKCQTPTASVLDPLIGEFLIMNALGAPHDEIVGYVAPIPRAYALSETAAVYAVDISKIQSQSLAKLGHEGLKFVPVMVELCVELKKIMLGKIYLNILMDLYKPLRKNRI